MGKCILIIRVSTQKQKTERQHQQLVEWCISEGYTPNDMIIIENKESATKTQEQKTIQELYKTIEQQQIDCVYTTEISRISRKPAILEQVKHFLIAKKVNLKMKQQNFVLFDENGKVTMIANILFDLWKNFTESEIEQKNDRVISGMEVAANANQFIGGSIYMGYKVVNKSFQIDENNAKIIKKIFEMYATGLQSFSTIQKEILSIFSVDLDRKTIGRILNNKYYTGEKLKKDKYERQYPAIITHDIFVTCQELLNKRSGHLQSKAKKIYYAGRLIKCQCGETLTAFGVRNNYACKSFHEKRGCTNGTSINLNLVDSLAYKCAKIKDTIEMANINEEKIKQVEETINELQTKIDSASNRFEIIKENKRKSLKKHLKNLSSKDFENVLENELKIDLLQIENENIGNKNEIERLKNWISSTKIEKFGKWGTLLAASDQQKNIQLDDKQIYDLVHLYIKNIEVVDVDEKTKDIIIHTYCGEETKYKYYFKAKGNYRLFEYRLNPLKKEYMYMPCEWNNIVTKRF